MTYLAITGQKNLALAELETRFTNISDIGDAIVINTDKKIDINNFGSIIKLAVQIEIKSSNLSEDIANIIESKYSKNSLSSIDFAISNYTKTKLIHIESEVKKILQSRGIKSRFVRTNGKPLNAASVIYNNLVKKGVEIIICGNSNNLNLAETIAVQDINSYTKRDMDRPRKDLKVGMFPPKLAQIVINLASPNQNEIIFDPFCGSGVILQEGLLQDYNVLGSDIEDDMVYNSQKNLEWLMTQYDIDSNFTLKTQDAKNIKNYPSSPYVICTEGFLGKVFKELPSKAEIDSVSADLKQIYIDFFKGLKKLNNQPKTISITLPCWRQKNSVINLNIVDQILKLGYTIKQLKTVDSTGLIYLRENQIVGRQLLVFKPI